MMVRLAQCLVVLLLGASSAFASPTRAQRDPAPSATKVQRAVTSLRDDADSAFVGSWQALRDNEYAQTLSAGDVRAAELWIVLGNSIGVCRDHVPNKTMADWLAAFDGLSIGINDPELRSRFKNRGFQALDEGEKYAASRLTVPKVKNVICKTEVAALQQILQQPL